eukprot:TRINITY_DN7466_c0_g2_i1.p1 TRINITY_DN7466_c0_g2~~TRINITY_DN7466_c0_g2_i1.p1  ORF type:complete len:722 (+),score=199.44 TRINITY_DN7466_c0_g2_i1:568-2733(+)
MATRQGHLEAGKRRLEEFRRKKAGGKAKQVVASQNVNSQTNVDTILGQTAENYHANVVDAKESIEFKSVDSSFPKAVDNKNLKSQALATQNEDSSTRVLTNGLENGNLQITQEDKGENKIVSSNSDFSKVSTSSPAIGEHLNSRRMISMQRTDTEDGVTLSNGEAEIKGLSRYAFFQLHEHSSSQNLPKSRTNSHDMLNELPAKDAHSNEFKKNTQTVSMTLDHSLPSSRSIYNSDNQSDFSNSTVNQGEYKGAIKETQFQYSSFNNNSTLRNHEDSSSHSALSTWFESSKNIRRSRPSFLDSITTPSQQSEKKNEISGLDLHQQDKENIVDQNGLRFNDEKMESDYDLGTANRFLKQQLDLSPQKNDDFAALEQHIEDLTQEKFALQRALDSSRALAESLAQENSSLTDAFNQQGAVVNQLKADLERKQEEINAQLVVLNALKCESENAQLECSAADERAKMLASEVISLEEKALKLRSNELKLEKQLERLQEELNSKRRNIHNMEKEQTELQSTIDALQEEKRQLQSKLRKTASVEFSDTQPTSKSSKDVKDACTSTEDLALDIQLDTHVSQTFEGSRFDETTSSEYPEERQSVPKLPVVVPDEQQKIISNISSLIDELASEKDKLTRALRQEVAETARLKASNQDLSQKLEAQTQRLELLISQNMAHEGHPPDSVNYSNIHEEIQYVDEGDEVVERVLGWIMKLFPGGSSKRRTSKLL